MLFVKNMVFLDGAIATLAPDLDIFAEIADDLDVLRHHPRRAHRRPSSGIDPDELRARPRRACKASFGVDPARPSALTYRELQERREIIREPACRSASRRSATPAVARSMRLVIARCSVDYEGRLTRAPADGHPADHGEGRRLRGHPRRRRRLQAAQLDERAEPARRGRRRVDGHQPEGRDAHDHDRGGAVRHRPRPRRRPGPAEGRRRGPPPGAAGRQLRRASRPGCAWCAASTPPTSAPSTCSAATPTARPWPSRSSAAARSTASSSSPATSSSSNRDPMLRPVRGMFVAQADQAPGQGAGRRARHRVRRGRLRRAPRHRVPRAPPLLTPSRSVRRVSSAPTDRTTLRQQYKDGSTLDARSSLYEWQEPRHDLVATVVAQLRPGDGTGGRRRLRAGPVPRRGAGRGLRRRRARPLRRHAADASWATRPACPCPDDSAARRARAAHAVPPAGFRPTACASSPASTRPGRHDRRADQRARPPAAVPGPGERGRRALTDGVTWPGLTVRARAPRARASRSSGRWSRGRACTARSRSTASSRSCRYAAVVPREFYERASPQRARGHDVGRAASRRASPAPASSATRHRPRPPRSEPLRQAHLTEQRRAPSSVRARRTTGESGVR